LKTYFYFLIKESRLKREKGFALAKIRESLHNQIILILTGEAGTGKSAVLDALISVFQAFDKTVRRELILCGSTRAAASRFQGTTFHKLCGFGMRKEVMENLNSTKRLYCCWRGACPSSV
jgi:predicted ATPase